MRESNICISDPPAGGWRPGCQHQPPPEVRQDKQEAEGEPGGD